MLERGEGGASRRPRRRRTCAIGPARKISPGLAHETSDGALRAAGSEVEYGTFQRPVRRFLPATWVSLQRPGPAAVGRRFPGRASSGLAHRTGRMFAPAPGGKAFTFPGKTSPRRTMPTPSASPGLLVCRTGTPDAPFGDETTGPVRRPAVSPVSPEGDHFPQALEMQVYVCPAPQAPPPPRRNALRCIRGGMRGVWHGFLGWGKEVEDKCRR